MQNILFVSHCILNTAAKVVLYNQAEIDADGSPSCGVDYTSCGNWYGSFAGRDGLEETLAGCTLGKKHGILMDVLCGMLKEEGLDETIRVTSLFAPEPEKCMALLQGL